MCDMCMEEACLAAARHCGSMDSAIEKATRWVTRHMSVCVWMCEWVCLCVSVCMSLGLWAGDLCGPSLSLLRKSP